MLDTDFLPNLIKPGDLFKRLRGNNKSEVFVLVDILQYNKPFLCPTLL